MPNATKPTDLAERILHLATICTPPRRRPWARAMAAELATLTPPRQRVAFSGGCLLAAISLLIEEAMPTYLRRTRGVCIMSLLWASLWALLFAVMLQLITVLHGPNTDPPLSHLLLIATQVGLLSGAAFALLVAVTERRRPLGHLSLRRAAIWGALASTLFPLLTGRANQIFWTSTFGAIAAVVLVGIAHRAAAAPSGTLRRCAALPLADLVDRT